MKKYVFFLLLIFLAIPAMAQENILQKNYNGFTVWLDCERHGAIAFHYTISADCGNIPRQGDKFITDPSVPAACQPQNGNSYRTATAKQAGMLFDRGHLTPANHMDNNEESFVDTFYVTNILPQQSSFNQHGAWRHTENITECYRDISTLEVWGGVVWGNDQTNDYFTATHGLETPDYWWKLIYRHDKQEYIAWLFPNSKDATRKKIEQYRISLKDLKKVLEYVPGFEGLPLSPTESTTPWAVKGSRFLTCEGHTTSGG